MGNDSIVEALLEKGNASPNTKNIRQKTALTVAASEGHLRVVNLLLCYGADTDILDAEWNSPLLMCCQNSQNLAVVEALIVAGADVNIVNQVRHSYLTLRKIAI